jgi:hypothetical protein
MKAVGPIFNVQSSQHSQAIDPFTEGYVSLSYHVLFILSSSVNTRVYPEVSGLAAWSENCKWYSSLPLGAVVSLFYEAV